MSNRLNKILSWMITILIPLTLLFTSIRILITPLFAQLEYVMPGFPDDPYGFSQEDRLRWSKPSIQYLVNSEDINFLRDLKFQNGESIYNDRELSHMEDVKTLVRWMIKVWLFFMAFILLAILWLEYLGDRKSIRLGFYRGGWGAIGLIILILLMVFIDFDQLFSSFHALFFEGDTWLFYESDTLIRLFPIRFWQDAFIFVGLFTLVTGIIFILLLSPHKKDRK